MSPMTTEEARAAVVAIKQHVQQARALLLDLHEREGWIALGYDSWERCVTSEFGHSRSYMYRQLAAAKLELEVGSDVGSHPESHMRAINETLSEDDQMREAYEYAARNNAMSAAEYRKVAMEVWLKHNLPEHSILRNRVKTGSLSVADAYQMGKLQISDVPKEVKVAIDSCTDPELADMLVKVNMALPELWAEIADTGTIPGVEENIPIWEATGKDLRAYLTLDSAERRARYVEDNRDYYDRRSQITDGVIYGARVMILLAEHDLYQQLKEVAKRVAELIDELDNL